MTTCTTHHYACACRERLFVRALEIADEAMTELLMAHAKRADEFGVMWSLCDTEGNDVAVLADADEPVIEAVQWLKDRNMCDLHESPDGATVVLFGEMP